MLEITPLASPWPTACGGADAGCRSSYPGPRSGEVTASWTPPPDQRLTAGPIITTDGRVALGLSGGVTFLDPGNLLPIRQLGAPLARPRWIAAAAGDAVMVATAKDAFAIDAGYGVWPLDVRTALGGQRANALVPIGEELVLAASDEHLALLDSGGGRPRASVQLAGAAGPVIGHVAVRPSARYGGSPASMVYVAGATRSSSPGDPAGHHGHLIGLSLPDLGVEFHHESSELRLPLSTGLQARLSAWAYGAILAEDGLVIYGPKGYATRDDFQAATGTPVAHDDSHVIYASRTPRALILQMMPRAVDDTVPDPIEWMPLREGESVRALALAGGREELYVATSTRVAGIGSAGEHRFTVPIEATRLVCGNGFLLCVTESPLKLVRIG